jgi:hypothetical protein
MPCWQIKCILSSGRQGGVQIGNATLGEMGRFSPLGLKQDSVGERYSMVFQTWVALQSPMVYQHIGVSENSEPLNPMVLLIIIPIKWL